MRRLGNVLALVAAVACFGDTEIDLRIKGQMTKVRSQETPKLVVNGLDEVKAHYAEVRDLLPPPPFIMDGQWVVRLDANGPKTFPDRADAQEFFSPNGEYVLQVQRFKTPEGWPGAQKQWLLGTDGRRYWERQRDWAASWVLDTGRTLDVWPESEMGPVRMEVVDRDSGRVLRKAVLGYRSISTSCFPPSQMLVVSDDVTLTALDEHGEAVWSTQAKDVKQEDRWLSELIGMDPLGRGYCVLMLQQRDGVSAVVLNPKTGQRGPVIMGDLPSCGIDAWSPRGTKAAISSRAMFGLLDWAAGRLVFTHAREDEDHLIGQPVDYSHSLGVSDEPARLALPRRADTVFDGSGQVVWRNTMAAGASRRLVLSSDGLRLGVVLWEWATGGKGPTVSSLVVYDLPVDGQAMRGL